MIRDVGKAAEYMLGLDFLADAKKREIEIIGESAESVTLRGNLRVSAEYGKAMAKVMVFVPLRWTGIDGAVRLVRRYHPKNPNSTIS